MSTALVPKGTAPLAFLATGTPHEPASSEEMFFAGRTTATRGAKGLRVAVFSAIAQQFLAFKLAGGALTTYWFIDNFVHPMRQFATTRNRGNVKNQAADRGPHLTAVAFALVRRRSAQPQACDRRTPTEVSHFKRSPPMKHLAPVIQVVEEKCVNCHACIAACPVKFCNDGSHDVVKLNPDACLGCGLCIDACTHEARVLADDTERFLKDAASGVRMVAVVRRRPSPRISRTII